LNAALDAIPDARACFDSLSGMKCWELLYWINGAKRDSTGADLVRQVAEVAAEGKRPSRFRQ